VIIATDCSTCLDYGMHRNTYDVMCRGRLLRTFYKENNFGVQWIWRPLACFPNSWQCIWLQVCV